MKTLFNSGIFIVLLSVSLFAQAGSVGLTDPVSVAMGKTYTTTTRGVYAVGINPANLALSDAGHIEAIVLPPNMSLRLGTDFLSIDEYNYFFGGVTDPSGNKVGRFLNNSDKDRLRDLFKDGGMVFLDVNSLDLAFTYKPSEKFGAIGFTVQDVFSTKFNFPAGIIDLAVSGNPVDKEYNFNDFRLKSWYLRTYTLAYARNFNELFPKLFKSFSAGISLKYVAGYAYAGLERNTLILKTNADRSITETTDLAFRSAVSPDFGVNYDFDSLSADKSSNISAFPATAGSGSAFDIGFAAELNDRWSFGLAITDIGSITWKQQTAEYTSKSTYHITDVSDSTQKKSLTDSIKIKGRYISEFSTSMPTCLRLGATYIFVPNLFKLSADINIGFNDNPRNEKSPRFSLGGEWNPLKWLPYLRGGFSFGGNEVFSWAVGLGINAGPIEFSAATPDFQYIFTPKDGKRISCAFGWRWKFN